MNQKPIGIFDSGLGGLTAFKELKKLLPHENIVYFGDTGRVPYGTRGRDTIMEYAKQDIEFLLQYDVKLIIVACGTVSTTLPQAYADALPVPVLTVVQPAVAAACQATKNGRIGVTGTSATIRSGAYGKAIRAILPQAQVTGVACPLFVPLVENGFIGRENTVTKLVARQYLVPLKQAKADTVILGCTHFPVIQEVIGDCLGPNVSLIDSGKEAAKAAAELLLQRRMLREESTAGQYRFFVSDTVELFTQNAGLFLGEEIDGMVEQHMVV